MEENTYNNNVNHPDWKMTRKDLEIYYKIETKKNNIWKS